MPEFCIYLRKSRADLELEAKGEMETLARHEKALLDLAKRQRLNITQIYREIVSGETIQARPVVQQLLDEVEQGQWAGVLVMEVERLARGDTIDQGVVARAFKIGNSKIVTPMKSYDPSNEFDEEYFEFGLFMSRREYKTINRRIQRGRVASAKEGKFLSSMPPYGYDKVKIAGDKGYTLRPNSEAEIVQLIFQCYVDGIGMTQIANKLDEMRIKPRYRETWSKSTLSDILQNPVYTGKIRWSYRQDKLVNENGELVKKRRANADPVYVQGLHPAIVEEDIFNQVQKVRGKNAARQVKKGYVLQNPLAGLIFCKKCGATMTRLAPNKRMKYAALHCSNRYCDSVSAPVELIEKKVLENLRKWLTGYKLLGNVPERKNYSQNAHQTAMKNLNTELQKIDLQISNTFDLLEQRIYTAELFTQRNKVLADKRTETVLALERLESEYQSEREEEITRSELIPLTEQVLEGYGDAESAEVKNNLLRQVVQRIEYSKDAPNRRGNWGNDNFEIFLYPKFPKGGD